MTTIEIFHERLEIAKKKAAHLEKIMTGFQKSLEAARADVAQCTQVIFELGGTGQPDMSKFQPVAQPPASVAPSGKPPVRK